MVEQQERILITDAVEPLAILHTEGQQCARKSGFGVWVMGAEIISLGFCLLERIREDTLEIDDPSTQFGFLPPASI